MTLGRTLETSTSLPAEDIPGLLSAVARGPGHASHLSALAAHALFAEWLSGHLSPLAQGALWTAYRLKGESVDELLGFVRATEESLTPLPLPGPYKPVVFPSYNGARRQANLLPLLALLLAREGVPVLIHGAYGSSADDGGLELPQHDPKARVTTGAILTYLGYPPAPHRLGICTQFQKSHLSYAPIDILHPQLASILSLRRALGVRSSVHTIIKLFNPFAGEAVLCAAVTHPPYLAKMRAFFVAARATALVFRGTEGEPVVHAKRRPALFSFHDGQEQEWFPEDKTPLTDIPALPDDRSVISTCRFINAVLMGHEKIPPPLIDQLACLLTMSGASRDPIEAREKLLQSHKSIRGGR